MSNVQTRSTPASELSMEDLEQIAADADLSQQDGQDYEIIVGTSLS